MISLLGGGCEATSEVWSSDVRELTMVHGGGGLGPPFIRTTDCPWESVEYRLSVEPQQLEVAWCLANDHETEPEPLQRMTASRVISQAEFDALVPKLQALHVTRGGCGADKASVTTTVTARNGESTVYGDSFYSGCSASPGSPNDDRPGVDYESLDDVLVAFGALLSSPP